MTLSEVINSNSVWFSKGNMQFFGDLSYQLVRARSGKYFLVRETYAWTDMFGREKVKHWRLNEMDGAKIKSLTPDIFAGFDEVEQWLENN